MLLHIQLEVTPACLVLPARQQSHKDLLFMLKTLEMWANIEGEHKQSYHMLCSNIASAMGEVHKTYKFRKTMKKKKEGKEGKEEN